MKPLLVTLGLFIGITLIVCGWHYLRIWKTFGTPLVTNWEFFVWWADDGFRTTAYFMRFGQCLIQPFFSGFYGFADGVYSTLWGDSLCGGLNSFIARPPWNEELIAAGMLLSLLPTMIILTGLVACSWRFFRRPEPVWFLLLGIPLAMLAALVYLNLKVPWTCTIKAFYCMGAMLPICVFGSAGWGILYEHTRRFRPVLCVFFGVWALNAYTSYWIWSETYSTHTARGELLLQDHRYDEATKEFSQALKMAPDYAGAHNNLGTALASQGKLDEAFQHWERTVQLDPHCIEAHFNWGTALARQGKLDEAIQHLERAIQLNPDYAEAHYNLGRALADQGKLDEAIQHLELTLKLKPGIAEAHYSLGIMLNARGRLNEAIQHFQQALNLAVAQHNLTLVEAIRTRYKDSQPPRSQSQSQ